MCISRLTVCLQSSGIVVIGYFIGDVLFPRDRLHDESNRKESS